MGLTETVVLSRSTDPGAAGPAAVIPRQLGSVRLVRQIGEGGMGVVWLGHDDMLGRDVAVKFLLSAVASMDDPGAATFIEGARAAAAVRHPGLILVYQADLISGVPYLVMEYVAGPTLGQVLKQTGAMGVPPTLAVLDAVSTAIGALHDQGIIHRDIKPANLLLDADAKIYVTDFGLACARPTAAAGGAGPGSGGVAGTPPYMAPEMFDGAVSVRSDVYALGIMAFELLTDALPFPGSLDEIRQAHKSTPLPIEPLQQHQIDPALIEVIERATHKNILFRYKSARHFLQALREAQPNAGIWTRGGRDLSVLVAKCLGAPAGGQAPGSTTADAATYYDLIATKAKERRRESDLVVEAAAAGAGAPVAVPSEGQGVSVGAATAATGGDPAEGAGAEAAARGQPQRTRSPAQAATGPAPPTAPGLRRAGDPVWPLVIGILVMVLSAFAMLHGAIGLFRPAIMDVFDGVMPSKAPNPAAVMARWAPGLRICAVVTLGLAGLAMASGHGLLRCRRWSITTALAWSWLKIVWALTLSGVVLLMGQEQIAAVSQEAKLSGAKAGVVHLVLVFGLLLLTLWRAALPVFLLLWFNRAKVRQQVAGWR